VRLVAVAKMTSHVSRAASSNAQAARALMEAGKLRPGDKIAITSSLAWALWVPQAFEVSWTELEPFAPRWQPLPAGTTVVGASDRTSVTPAPCAPDRHGVDATFMQVERHGRGIHALKAGGENVLCVTAARVPLPSMNKANVIGG
jgi:hypothetical protein